jgi:hypothetical protein
MNNSELRYGAQPANAYDVEKSRVIHQIGRGTSVFLRGTTEVLGIQFSNSEIQWFPNPTIALYTYMQEVMDQVHTEPETIVELGEAIKRWLKARPPAQG